MNKMKRPPLLLLLPLLLQVSSCATTPATSAETLKSLGTFSLVGKTRYQEQALSGGEITALRAEPGGAAYRAPVMADGDFRLDLPPGPYYLMGSARDPVSGRDLFAFWNNNPLQVYGNIPVPITLPFVTATPPPEKVPGQGGIRGRVLLEGKPVPGALVAVFLDACGGFHGLPYAQASPTGVDGVFSLDLEPGKYFVVSRSRGTGEVFQGPLLRGDLSGFYPHNPVILRSGEGLVLDVPVVPVNRPRGTGTLVPGETIVVEGRVRTIAGQGAPGVRVVLYDIPEMLGRPAFLSSPADEAGKYRLEVSRSGTFYAAARSVIGRPPETGELMGFYEGSEDHSLVLKWGDRLEGVDIVVREVW